MNKMFWACGNYDYSLSFPLEPEGEIKLTAKNRVEKTQKVYTFSRGEEIFFSDEVDRRKKDPYEKTILVFADTGIIVPFSTHVRAKTANASLVAVRYHKSHIA